MTHTHTPPRASIEIVDVTARDGLQNESVIFTTPQKVALIGRAVEAGARRLEVASFVHPKRVPQMADAEAVLEALPRCDDVTYIGLVLNPRGFERAQATQVDEIGCVAAASDGFATRNQGQTAPESLEIAKAIVRDAKAAGLRANITISTAFGCPFDGEVPIERVVDMAVSAAEAGPHEIALADTIGVGTPWHVETLFGRVRDALPDMPLRAHFHDTRNTAVANAVAAIRVGATVLDGAIGGIGGCPFAPNATGNVAVEDLVYMLERSGVATGLSLDSVIGTAGWLSEQMGRTLPGAVSRAGGFPAPG